MAFRLNEENGELSMKGRVPAGEYTVVVKVHDYVWEMSVKSTVKIVIKDIDEQAVLSSGSLRFQGHYVGNISAFLILDGGVWLSSI